MTHHTQWNSRVKNIYIYNVHKQNHGKCQFDDYQHFVFVSGMETGISDKWVETKQDSDKTVETEMKPNTVKPLHHRS